MSDYVYKQQKCTAKSNNYQGGDVCDTWIISTIYVLEGEYESFIEVEHELHSLTSEIQEQEEFDQLLQEMAQTVMEYEEQLDCSAVGVAENTGKPIEEVGQRREERF